jgi:hypothetical protein
MKIAPEILPLFPVLYAETHYTLKGLSLIFRRRPEIVCDAPYRVEPGNQVPVLVLIRDADRFPVRLHSAAAKIRYTDGSIEERILLNEPVDIEARSWHRLFRLQIRDGYSGEILIEPLLRVSGKGRSSVQTVRTHNYPGRKPEPLSVLAAQHPLPRPAGWIFADLHHHTEFTSDQVEYGAPLEATAEIGPAMGLSAAAVTDHSYDLDDSDSSYRIKDPELKRWKAMAAACGALEKRTGFVLLPGEELSCGNSEGMNVHLLLLGNRTFIPGSGDSAEAWFKTRPDRTLREVLDGKEAGALAYAAHPEHVFHFLQRRLLSRGKWGGPDYGHPNLDGLEILNGPADRDYLLGLRRWITLLLEGRRLYLAAGNDAHGAYNRTFQLGLPWISIREKRQYLFGKSRTGILPDGKAGRETVMEALAAGRTFITTGPAMTIEVRNESGEAARMGGSINGSRFSLTVECMTSEEFGPIDHGRLWLGDLSAKAEKPWIEFKVPVPEKRFTKTFELENLKTEVYVRGIVVTRTGEGTFFCLTNPIWINRTPGEN